MLRRGVRSRSTPGRPRAASPGGAGSTRSSTPSAASRSFAPLFVRRRTAVVLRRAPRPPGPVRDVLPGAAGPRRAVPRGTVMPRVYRAYPHRRRLGLDRGGRCATSSAGPVRSRSSHNGATPAGRRRTARSRTRFRTGSSCSAGWSRTSGSTVVRPRVRRVACRQRPRPGWTSSARARSRSGWGTWWRSSGSRPGHRARLVRRRAGQGAPAVAGLGSTSAPRTPRAGARWSSRRPRSASRRSPGTCPGCATPSGTARPAG